MYWLMSLVFTFLSFFELYDLYKTYRRQKLTNVYMKVGAGLYLIGFGLLLINVLTKELTGLVPMFRVWLGLALVNILIGLFSTGGDE